MSQAITHIYIVKNKECVSHILTPAAVVYLVKKVQNKELICSAFFYILLSVTSHSQLLLLYRRPLHNL